MSGYIQSMKALKFSREQGILSQDYNIKILSEFLACGPTL